MCGDGDDMEQLLGVFDVKWGTCEVDAVCSLFLDGVYVGVLLYWGVIFLRLGVAKAVGNSYFCIGYLFHLIEV